MKSDNRDSMGDASKADSDEDLVRQLTDYDEFLRLGAQSRSERRSTSHDATSADSTSLHDCLDLLERAWPRGTSPANPEIPARIGRFQLERVLGVGGFGIVYLATDPTLHRQVALKVPRLHSLANVKLRERFRREARAAAALDHPNIVPIHETGETGPVCYIASAYCQGPNLAEWLKAQTAPVPVRIAAALVKLLAEAVEYSHSQGVLHRDLKPSNVLLTLRDTEGGSASQQEPPFVPRLTDFGLAKLLGDDFELTAATNVVGTPTYMAPEQTGGRADQIGPATDVYGLGVILYELLTGHPPFQGDGIAEVFDQMRHSDPESPRRLRREIPRDLEVICLKCLEKLPGDRYQTAGLLADDLERFLTGRPTLAEPPSPIGRSIRWLKRHPSQAVSLATMLAAIVAVVSVSTWFATRLAGSRRETDLNNRTLDAEREKGRLQEINLRAAQIRERSQNHPRQWASQNLNDLATMPIGTIDEEVRRSLRGEAIRALCAVEFKPAAIIAENFDAYGLAYSPDGRYLAIGSNTPVEERGTVILANAETRMEIRRITFEPSPAVDKQRERPDGVRSLLFTSDSRRLLVGTRRGMIRVWDIDSEQFDREWHAHQAYVLALAFMPEFGVLLSLSEDWQLKSWQWPDGTPIQTIRFEKGAGQALGVIGDRVFVLGNTALNKLQYEPESRTLRNRWGPASTGSQLAVVPDQKSVVTPFSESDGSHVLAFFNASDGKICRKISDSRRKRLHEAELHGLAFSADGRWLASTAGDGLKLWDLVSGELATTLPNDANKRVSVAFRPRHSELAVSRDGRVEVCTIASSGVWDSSLHQSFKVTSIDLDAEGRVLVGSIESGPEDDDENSIAAVSLENGAIPNERRIPFANDQAVAISNDCRLLGHTIARSEGSPISVTRLNGSGSDFVLTPEMHGNLKPVFTLDDQRLWYAGITPGDRIGFLAFLSTQDGRERFRWLNDRSEHKLRKSGFLSLAVGSQLVAASSTDESVRLFDAESGQLLREIAIADQSIDRLAMSDDQKWVLCGTRGGKLLALSTADGRLKTQTAGHADAVSAICISRDGLAVTGCRDGMLTGWQFANGELRELFSIGPLSAGVRDIDIDRNGNVLAILVENETGVRLLKIGVLRRRLAALGLDWR